MYFNNRLLCCCPDSSTLCCFVYACLYTADVCPINNSSRKFTVMVICLSLLIQKSNESSRWWLAETLVIQELFRMMTKGKTCWYWHTHPIPKKQNKQTYRQAGRPSVRLTNIRQFSVRYAQWFGTFVIELYLITFSTKHTSGVDIFSTKGRLISKPLLL